jgi:hypothetical protein
MNDPVLDYINANSSGAAPQPQSDPVIDYINSSPKTAAVQQKTTSSFAPPVTVGPKYSPVSNLKAMADVAGGAGETIAGGVLGMGGYIGGGLAGLAGLAAGKVTGADPLETARRWQDWASRNISTVAGLYGEGPETTTGKQVQSAFNATLGRIPEAGRFVGTKTYDVTGNPKLATVADTATQAGLQWAAAALTGKVARAVSGGVSGTPEEIESAVDQGRGTASLPNATGMVASPAERQVAGGGAAVATSNPYPELTGQKMVRGGDFPMVQTSQIGGEIPLPEQGVRSLIANQILGEEGGDRIRPSVVSGSEDAARTEVALAKASNPTPQGLLLRDKMAQEQRSLQSFAGNAVAKTGASPTLLNDAQRGDLLNSTLYGPDSLRAFIDSEKGKIYAEAAQRQGPNPVTLTGFESRISDPRLNSQLQIAGLPNFASGVRGLLEQFKTNGFQNPVTGEAISPGTVGAAMELHKALNQSWTPDNAMYIGGLKKAILDDVAQAGGADLYQKANAIHAAEQTLYGAPGIKKIFGDVDPNTGISKAMSSEKIVPSLNNLPYDQYSHIYNVFDAMSNGRVPGAEGLSLPPELQIAARQSKAEMGGALVRDVANSGGDKIGNWNANSANKTLNAYSQKLNLAVPPDVLQDLHTLNIGGQIMPNIHAYEGAFQQGRRLDQAGLLERNLPQFGASIGAATRIPGAEWAMAKGGEKLQQRFALQRQLKAAQETDAAMEAAAKLGKQ